MPEQVTTGTAQRAEQASIPGKHVHLRGSPSPLLISQNASDKYLQSSYPGTEIILWLCFTPYICMLPLVWVPDFRSEYDSVPALQELTVWCKDTKIHNINTLQYIKVRSDVSAKQAHKREFSN